MRLDFCVYSPMLYPYMVAAFHPGPYPVCGNFPVEFAWIIAKRIRSCRTEGLVWPGDSFANRTGKGWGFLCPGESGWTAVVDGVKAGSDFWDFMIPKGTGVDFDEGGD